MRLITWNCQGAFRKKAHLILAENPDILIIQECEHPDKLIFNSETKQPNDFLWFGDNKHKGLGIFSYSDFRFQRMDCYNEDIKIIAPISVANNQLEFTLFAIWANHPTDPNGKYVEQIWKAIYHYDQFLNSEKTILIGDFNSNKIWDKTHRIGNHSDVVEKLAEKEIHSVYHRHLDQEQGKEIHPTFYLQRNRSKPYHIDYCFTSTNLYNKVNKLEIGAFENWIAYSDHLPLILNFDI